MTGVFIPLLIVLIAVLGYRNKHLSSSNTRMESSLLKAESQIRKLQVYINSEKEQILSKALTDTHVQARVTDSIINICTSLAWGPVIDNILDSLKEMIGAGQTQLILWQDPNYQTYGDTICEIDSVEIMWIMQKLEIAVSWDPPPGTENLMGHRQLPDIMVPIVASYQGDMVAGVNLSVAGVLIAKDVKAPESAEKSRLLLKQLNMLSRVSAVAVMNAMLHQTTENLARTDRLTQLLNRAYFNEQLEHELSRASRTQSRLCLVMLDVDHFKPFNDQYGHLAGDEVLREVSLCIRNSFRDIDICARYGGEEFIVLLPETSLQQAKVATERLRQTIETHTVRYAEHMLSVTVSVGVTECLDGDTVDSITKRADGFLYLAKSEGRNRVHTGDPVLDAQQLSTVQWSLKEGAV